MSLRGLALSCLLASMASSGFLCADSTNRSMADAPSRLKHYLNVTLPPSATVTFFHEESALDSAMWLKISLPNGDTSGVIKSLGFDEAALTPADPKVPMIGHEEEGFRPSKEKNLLLSEQIRIETGGFLQVALAKSATKAKPASIYVFYFTM